MSRVRSLIKLALFAATTVPLFALYLIVQFVSKPFPASRARAHGAMVRHWARVAAWCLSMRVIVEGAPPRPPFFLVCNHLSYVDVIALLTCVEGTFLAKSEIARWPLLGSLARGVGTLFIDRTRKRDLVRVTDLLRRELRDGRGIVVFPESTSSPGDEILPFKASTLEVAVEFGLPVHCAAIRYETPPGQVPARLSVCWWGEMTFAPHMIDLNALPEFTARIRFAADPVREPDRKALANSARVAVARLHAELAKRVEYPR